MTGPGRPPIGPAHKIRWFVRLGEEMVPRTSGMRGQWGYDVKCSCGWETKTGGAVKSYIDREVWAHKFYADRGLA